MTIKNTLSHQHGAIILIGMPGAGKSTIGVQLAKMLALDFVDTDILIQQKAGMSLQAWLDKFGHLALRELEQDILLHTQFEHSVIATGGSVVYSESGMTRLREIGICFYLQISCKTMLSRVNNTKTRGLAVAPGTTLEGLYEERLPLYEKWAEHTVRCDGKSQESILEDIAARLSDM